MTVYTTLPTDDQNLAITVTDDPDLVVLNITPASVSGVSVTTVNGQSGVVVLDTDDVQEDGSPINKYFTDPRAQTVITANSEGFIKADTTNTLTNKSGNISQWTNDSGYITSASEDDQTLSFSSPDLTITSGNTVDISALTSGLITASSTDTLTNKSGNISQWTNDSGYSTTTGTVTPSSTDTFTNKSGSNSQWTNDEGYTTNTGTVTASSTDTFTNKSGSNSQWTNDENYSTTTGTVTSVASGTGLTGGPITGTGTLSIDTGTTVDKDTAQTLTNKSIDLDSNTISGTLAEFNTALQSDSFVSLTGEETLTNKTLTTPIISHIKTNSNFRFETDYPSAWGYDWADSSFKMDGWQNPSQDTINIWTLSTVKDKNFFRIDCQNEGTSVNAGSFVTSSEYKITSAGDTDFTAIGADDNNVNTIFTATGAGSGTGTADTWSNGDHRVDFTLKGADDIGFVDAGSFVTSNDYEISTSGTTDFTLIGAADSNVGTTFTATGAGSGTGVAIHLDPYAGEWNQFQAHTSSQPGTGWPTNLLLGGRKISFHGNYTFPTTDGSANQVLTTDGSGQLSWAAPETITLATLKTEVAASTDFADFKSRIAAL